MANRISLAPGEYYHVYNRGTEKRDIFLSPYDYTRFLFLLYLANSQTIRTDIKLQGSTLEEILAIDRGDTLVNICAYVLMPNHFHLLLHEKSDGGISRFMQKLTTGYTMYFNKKNERAGALFQGRFKAKHAPNDAYLSYLMSYLHLNPIKLIEPNWKETGIADQMKAEAFLKEYLYSSYLDYLGQERTVGKIINREVFPEYLQTPSDFESNIKFWLQG